MIFKKYSEKEDDEELVTTSYEDSIVLFNSSDNYLTGQVPDSLGVLKDLYWLNLEFNNLGRGMSGDLNFPYSLPNVSSLRLINLHANNFRGVLPISIVNRSTQLQKLIIGGNKISGSIPKGIGNLISLTVFSAMRNNLTVSFPLQLACKLQNLRVFDLNWNRLSGLLPSTLGNSSQLYYLDTGYNNLEGNLPTSLRNCQNMEILFLDHNKLSGSVPENVTCHFNQLRSLYLQQNTFTGSLPTDVGQLKNLNQLLVSDNNLSGEIPRELGSCSVLEYLDMEKNSFQGNIPLSFSSLRGIRFLDLSCNVLPGTIPKELHLLESAKHGKGKHLSTKIVIAISITGASCLAFIVASVLLYGRKTAVMKSSSTFLRYGYLRVSYKELLKAASGFASSNLIGMGSFGSIYKGIVS
ncbi:hypothetical protein VitviT2T_007181 [Vitis vinifera]|uniref:LRR receptor-like serine/threonine-protein kinase n=1 Tax=Vitis vinifera TaxID=29760 RepID=A0ABY9C0T2_VITVI|nr:hypothetical protein VitviT2T_007181 [Vitis vinifera]